MPKAKSLLSRLEEKNSLHIIAIEHIVHFDKKPITFFTSKEHEKSDFKLIVEYDDHKQPDAIKELKKFHHGTTSRSVHHDGKKLCSFVFAIDQINQIKKILCNDNPNNKAFIESKFHELLHPCEILAQ